VTEKNTTVIVSDLHLGGGAADPGDDHVYQQGQFQRLIDELGGSSEGKQGDVELLINGDFLEFAQVNPDVYQLGSSTYWCSEEESLQKLAPILAGHAPIFAALKRFQASGNLVTIAAGNHDVEFYWPRIRERFSEAAGPVHFAVGDVWYSRYDGRLMITHGHMFDPANSFAHWDNPILQGPRGVPRLEMCAGTLFMSKFVNWLEKDYPFSDNIKPVTALGGILWREDRFGLAVVSWMLSRFLALYPKVALGGSPSDSQTGQRIMQLFELDPLPEGIIGLYQKVRGAAATEDAIRAELKNEEAVIAFLNEVLLRLPPEEWIEVFDPFGVSGTLGVGGDGTTLKILQSGTSSDVEILRIEATKRMSQPGGPKVVVMGHTHQPDELRTDDGVYFNPGSWTRYAEMEKLKGLTLENLREETDFPYQLNYVRIVKTDAGPLDAQMICFEQS
jgi:UDP-2,3-diacylglucosamine pyrophosphatase LpxH